MKSRFSIASAVLLVLVLIATLAAPALAAKPVVTGPVQFPGSKIQQFALPLPLLDAAGGTIQTIIDNGTEIPMRMVELRANMLPASFKPANGLPVRGHRGLRLPGKRGAGRSVNCRRHLRQSGHRSHT